MNIEFSRMKIIRHCYWFAIELLLIDLKNSNFLNLISYSKFRGLLKGVLHFDFTLKMIYYTMRVLNIFFYEYPEKEFRTVLLNFLSAHLNN